MTAKKNMTILNLKDEIQSLYAHIEGYKKALADLENKLRRSKANEDFEKGQTKFKHALLLGARRELDNTRRRLNACRHLLDQCQDQRDNIQALLQTSTQQVATLQQALADQLADHQHQLASIGAPVAGGARKTRRKRRRKRRG